jgi:signal transduction histidine kinase
MRTRTLLFWPAGVVLGLAAERVAFGWDAPLMWLPDLAVGWTFIGCGLAAMALRPNNNAGLLMAATGFTWFLGNFAGADTDLVAWVGSHTTYVHRGFLVHLILAYPIGRLLGRNERATAAAGYAVAFLTPVWSNDILTIVFAALLLAERAVVCRRLTGPARRARLFSLRVMVAISSILIASAVASLAAGVDADRTALLAYQVALVVIGGTMFTWLRVAPWERLAVTDLVVELGERDSGTIRGELSRALADPSLEVGYWDTDSDAFLDAEGQVLSVPDEGSERGVTIVRRGNQPVAALIHDRTELDNPGLLEAVSAATELAGRNARLQVELRRQVAELAASRRRILAAEDDQRRRLEGRLRKGAEQRLERMADFLRSSVDAGHEGLAKDRIAAAANQLEGTLTDMRRLASGLHPRELSERGLAAALTTVADSFPIPVSLQVTRDRMPERVESAAYFVCTEALANIAKYSGASVVRVAVARTNERATVMVRDDGVGGADPINGTGLRGLADRVETLGGTFAVRSVPEEGTRLTAEIPLHGDSA